MISKYQLCKKEVLSSFDILNRENLSVFISAFENCDRVKSVFSKIVATQKIWLLFPQYEIPANEKPTSNIFENSSLDEDEYFFHFFSSNTIDKDEKICVDITGFPRPHLIYFVRLLAHRGFTNVNIIYTEPNQYSKGENTMFSGFIDHVKSVPGCESGANNPKTDNDVLIIGSGYDDKLIAKIAQHKQTCKTKFEIFGFPSLQADMYQENRLKSASIRESIGENVYSRFAPAYDPFTTAELLSSIVNKTIDATNFYLSPLSSKPQALGFAYFFCREGKNSPLSIIYPYSVKYLTNTTRGVGRTWRYILEF